MTDMASGAEVVEATVDEVVDDALIQQLVARAKDGGLRLAGEDGLLQRLTRKLLESALEGEITDHLGHEAGERAEEGRRSNYRNGRRAKGVTTDIGPVELQVPRDRASTFEPMLVKKRQKRLAGVDEMVLSLSAQGSDSRRDLRSPGRGSRRATVMVVSGFPVVVTRSLTDALLGCLHFDPSDSRARFPGLRPGGV